MAASNPAAGVRAAPSVAAANPHSRWLILSLAALVLALALFQFSENTADPDLWGHITFGQEMIRDRTIPKTEIYSWTARGQPWINHEVVAEFFFGAAHSLAGGGGVLLLKVLIGMLTFWLCLKSGLSRLSGANAAIGWLLGALAVVEISYGFAARPQIFTALLLAIELQLLQQIHSRKPAWAIALPFLFAFWINTHGGALAGIGLLGLTAGVSTAQKLAKRSPSEDARASLWLWAGWFASIAALFCNPWGAGLIRWLIGSVLWLRPEISEWNPTPLGWDHAALFILIALAALAWLGTRLPRTWWEMAACAAFAVLAVRSVRNAPLFAIVALVLIPPHLADAFDRFEHLFAGLTNLFRNRFIQRVMIWLMLMAAAAVLAATLVLHKEHPLTMEVPRDKYPVAAVEFMHTNELSGKLTVFFDWGEMAIFHLPNCPPSIDGRLDTCYSRELIGAHWRFYNSEPFDRSVFDPEQSDLALLPSSLAGAVELGRQPGWQAVYFDSTAVVLVRDAARFSQLASRALPVQGTPLDAQGRAPLADSNPRWNQH